MSYRITAKKTEFIMKNVYNYVDVERFRKGSRKKSFLFHLMIEQFLTRSKFFILIFWPKSGFALFFSEGRRLIVYID